MRSGSHRAAQGRFAATHDERGVTLVETLVALGLFAVGAATMGDFLVHQIRTAQSNYNHTIAYSIAAEELEAMRARRFMQMAESSSQQTVGNMNYTLATTVADGVPAASMKRITVTVSWSEPGGPRNVSLRTIYTAIRR